MPIQSILTDKSLKSSDQSILIGNLLLENPFLLTGLLRLADVSETPVQATLIEAMEHASLKNPALIDADACQFVTGALTYIAPRVY